MRIIVDVPENHGRLIDADVFARNVVKYSHQSTKTIGQALADTPTIVNAVGDPVQLEMPSASKPHWIIESKGVWTHLYMCSKCGGGVMACELDLPQFCGHCGCKMTDA